MVFFKGGLFLAHSLVTFIEFITINYSLYMKNILVIGIMLISFHAFSQVSKEFTPLDVFNLEYISDPQISPDGSKIIYVRNFKDVMTDRSHSNLWITNFDGSQNRPLTQGNQNDFSPRWSNKGDKIIYKSNKDGKVQIYLRWMDSGIESKLTNSNTSPQSISWSPNDQYLAFNMFVAKPKASPIKMPKKPKGAKWNTPPVYVDDIRYRNDGGGYVTPGNSQLFILPVDGGTPTQLTEEEGNLGAPEWTKDGKSLLFSANLHDDAIYQPVNSEVYQLTIADGKITPLTNRVGRDGSPSISPDGKKLAYLGADDKKEGHTQNELYIANADGSSSKWITKEFDRGVNNIQWAADGKGLYFQYNDKGYTKLAYISTSGKVKDLTNKLGGLSLGRPYQSGAYSVANNGKYAFTINQHNQPADLAMGEGSTTKTFTQVNADLFEFKQLGEVEEVWYKSSYDQRDVQGWIVKPPNFDPNKKYPLILEIHGGPYGSYGDVFSAEIQLFAAAGYVVLYTNPRGSDGYGRDFRHEIHHKYPGNDYDDLMSGVDAIIEKGYIDKENLFVTGGSGGGTLTAWIVGKTDRFKAAVVAKPVINWTSFVLYTDGSVFWSNYNFSKMPWEDPEQYTKRSPLSLVGNVTTPTMLLTGESDYRTPIAETEQYYGALKLRKIDCAMVRIPNAGHGIAAKPSNLIGKVAAILSWFNKYKGI